jgi:hypothetical protein
MPAEVGLTVTWARRTGIFMDIDLLVGSPLLLAAIEAVRDEGAGLVASGPYDR